MRRIRAHRRRGDRVVLMTGALDFLVDSLRHLGDELIAARLVERTGRFTGELAEPPLTADGRASLAARLAAEHGLDLADCHAYGDSIADLPLLELVGHPHAINPDFRLAREARRRGWPVEDGRPSGSRSDARAALHALAAALPGGARRRAERRRARARGRSARRALPAPDWLPVRPRLSGICGSDQALLAGKASLYLASLTSGPFVPGHEVVGEITGGPRRGERVVLQPALGCAARGIEPAAPSAPRGLPALCRHTIDGSVSAGLQTGYCRDAGGGWSEGLVAHASQLHPVPDDLPDEDAVFVEPLACALHAAAVADPQPGERVAVIGAGHDRPADASPRCASARRPPRSCAPPSTPARPRPRAALGADDTCAPGELHVAGARLTGARRLVGHGGRELLLGGFDRVLDCVGSGASARGGDHRRRARAAASCSSACRASCAPTSRRPGCASSSCAAPTATSTTSRRRSSSPRGCGRAG